MKKNARQIALIGISTFIATILLIFGWYSLFGPEQYYVFEPYIDTEMAPDYTPEKFNQIHAGMTKDQVISTVGAPLTMVQDTIHNEVVVTYYYTNDGKLFYKDVPWYMARDYAWYRSSIELDSNDHVTHIDKGWSYD